MITRRLPKLSAVPWKILMRLNKEPLILMKAPIIYMKCSGQKRSCYFIVTTGGEMVAGAGIFPTEGLPPKTCELVKMYVSATARGKGLGKILLQKCIDEAKNNGFKKMYIETMPELTTAIEMYKKYGFNFIPYSLGNSGHSGCDLFMMREL